MVVSKVFKVIDLVVCFCLCTCVAVPCAISWSTSSARETMCGKSDLCGIPCWHFHQIASFFFFFLSLELLKIWPQSLFYKVQIHAAVSFHCISHTCCGLESNWTINNATSVTEFGLKKKKKREVRICNFIFGEKSCCLFHSLLWDLKQSK